MKTQDFCHRAVVFAKDFDLLFLFFTWTQFLC
jgi:hypothetical protein